MKLLKKTYEDPHQWVKELYKRLLSLKELLPQKNLRFPDSTMLNKAKMINEEIRVLLEKSQQQAAYHHLSADETELLKRINKGFPSDFWNRYHELQTKRRNANLTNQEQAEIVDCSDAIELANLERIGYLVKLAELRNVPLSTLVEQLGIAPSVYA